MGSLITKVNKSGSRASAKVRATSKGKKAASKKPQRPGKITATPKSKAAKAKKAAPVKVKKQGAPAKKSAAKPAKKALTKKSAKPAIAKKPVRAAKKPSKRPVATKGRAASARQMARPAPPPPKKAPAPSTLAAVRAFEQALKSFNRHDFSSAKSAFVDILDKFSDQAEIAARARTYLAISEQRLARAPSAPRGPDALYDQGVFELNKGNTKEAIELFEKALKSEPRADHILYSLAAAYARLNDTNRAIDALRRAINIRSVHRPHARRDLDFASLRSNEDFQQLTGYGYDFIED
ncbi:MAG TPA: tetratricopeptide repeat protein [Blastocatellia bacterium]|nr:tetratricopeptide repeat protein [Blastocatellia bacterium]